MPATLTKLLGLSKPAVDDNYDLAVWNSNTDLIESELGPMMLRLSEYIMTLSTKVDEYYTVVEFRTSGGLLYMRSTLSNRVNLLYNTCTWVFYDTDGLTVLRTVTWALTYDADNNLVSATPTIS